MTEDMIADEQEGLRAGMECLQKMFTLKTYRWEGTGEETEGERRFNGFGKHMIN